MPSGAKEVADTDLLPALNVTDDANATFLCQVRQANL